MSRTITSTSFCSRFGGDGLGGVAQGFFDGARLARLAAGTAFLGKTQKPFELVHRLDYRAHVQFA